MFEKCGKLFFTKMRPVYFFALLIMPIFIVGVILTHQKAQLTELQVRFQKAFRKERASLEKQMRKEAFLMRHSEVNPYFLNEVIETIPLLQKERMTLESLVNHPVGAPNLKERLAFIKENRLAFQEENMETSALMQEVEEKQRFPVQMDERDLQHVLNLLENSGNQTPQILIKDFRLKKLETPIHSEVFEVEMDLIKREFFQS